MNLLLNSSWKACLQPQEKREARLAELEAKVQSLQAPQSPEELWRIRSQSQSLEALSLSMQRLAADLGRQVARLDDLERERGEGDRGKKWRI